MREISLKLLKKIELLKENNQFYKERYSSLNLSCLTTLEEWQKNVPILTKEDIFNPSSIKKITDFSNGIIFPSAGTTSNNFSFRYELNNFSNESFNRLLLGSLDKWFDILKKKTLIINAYPLGISLPKGPYTVINTGIRDDIIFYTLSYLTEELENIILIAQPHFLKHLIDSNKFNDLEINKQKLNFILGGYWFPVTFEIYVLKKLFQNEWESHINRIKSTFGTAETGLGVLLDYPVNLRFKLFQKNPKVLVPLVYSHSPDRHFIEEVNGEMVITTVEDSNPELIRYNLKDKISFPSSDSQSLELREYNDGNMIYLYGRSSQDNLSLISQKLYLDYEIASELTGNFYIDETEKIIVQLSSNSAKNGLEKKLQEIMPSEIKVVSFEDYPFKLQLDRKPMVL